MTRIVEAKPVVKAARGFVRMKLSSYGHDGKTIDHSETFALSPHAAFALSQMLSKAALEFFENSNVSEFQKDGGDDD
jgi:hypothetical protein